MQIGDDDLDRVRDEVIFPALQAAGPAPRRSPQLAICASATPRPCSIRRRRPGFSKG
jgi:hypothetical protein